jgi:hypothetical protein
MRNFIRLNLFLNCFSSEIADQVISIFFENNLKGTSNNLFYEAR